MPTMLSNQTESAGWDLHSLPIQDQVLSPPSLLSHLNPTNRHALLPQAFLLPGMLPPPFQTSAPCFFSLFLKWDALAWGWFPFPALERPHTRTLSAAPPLSSPSALLYSSQTRLYLSSHFIPLLPPNDPAARVTRDSQPTHTIPDPRRNNNLLFLPSASLIVKKLFSSFAAASIRLV